MSLTKTGASVWDGELREKVIDVEGGNWVFAVDVSLDSTRFATGTGFDKNVSIWSITSGKRLVGPLEHDKPVGGIKFSPGGEHIATAIHSDSIHIFDSRNGHKLITIQILAPSFFYPITPLAWSNDGQQIFTASDDRKIKSFDASTGSKIAESSILDGNEVESIALAANNKFIAAHTSHSILFLDTSSLSHIVPPSLAGDHDSDPRPTSEQPGGPSTVESESRNEDGDNDILEVEVPSSTPAPQFDYDEPPSPVSSAHPREDDAPPLGASHAVPQSSDVQQANDASRPSPASFPNKDASRGGQGPVDPTEADRARQVNDPSQPLAVPPGVHVTREAYRATVAVGFRFELPAWMLCWRPLTEDGTH
ncbi:WD40-repeat-containing domain protein [Lanmaoa asiatica]|nr:WD40-repeat-containing domain protein [Lanmaoa asiatica]